jgi:hypothetical protein
MKDYSKYWYIYYYQKTALLRDFCMLPVRPGAFPIISYFYIDIIIVSISDGMLSITIRKEE